MNSPNFRNNQATLLTLALRLLDRREPGALKAEATQLIVGKLPVQLPVELPLPNGSWVVGSLVRNKKQTIIVLNTERYPKHVLNFYRKRLQANGWNIPEHYKLGDFKPAHITDYVLFFHDSQDIALWVEAYRVQGLVTSVRLQLETKS